MFYLCPLLLSITQGMKEQRDTQAAVLLLSPLAHYKQELLCLIAYRICISLEKEVYNNFVLFHGWKMCFGFQQRVLLHLVCKCKVQKMVLEMKSHHVLLLFRHEEYTHHKT